MAPRRSRSTRRLRRVSRSGRLARICARGEVVLRRGTLLRHADIGLLASIGRAQGERRPQTERRGALHRGRARGHRRAAGSGADPRREPLCACGSRTRDGLRGVRARHRARQRRRSAARARQCGVRRSRRDERRRVGRRPRPREARRRRDGSDGLLVDRDPTRTPARIRRAPHQARRRSDLRPTGQSGIGTRHLRSCSCGRRYSRWRGGRSCIARGWRHVSSTASTSRPDSACSPAGSTTRPPGPSARPAHRARGSCGLDVARELPHRPAESTAGAEPGDTVSVLLTDRPEDH